MFYLVLYNIFLLTKNIKAGVGHIKTYICNGE